jgi:5'(3')-deoxyribonucleotidase
MTIWPNSKDCYQPVKIIKKTSGFYSRGFLYFHNIIRFYDGMRMKICAVDVDLTVVDTLNPWLNWFENLTGKRVLNLDNQYNLVPEMEKLMQEVGCKFNPMAWWSRSDLYDDLKPIEDSVECLKYLARKYKIVFVSSCISGHVDSKAKFLDKHFGFNSGFVSTHKKHFVDYSILIDDNLQNVISSKIHRPESTNILFTNCRLDGGKKAAELAGCIMASNWRDVLIKVEEASHAK